MRYNYWASYQIIVYKKFFYEAHQRRSEKLIFIAKLLCSVVSILSVLIWSISKSMPVLWACLIALAQMAQSMLGDLPWSEQLNSLRYLIPALNRLIVDMDADWMRLGYAEVDDETALLEKAVLYDRKYFELEDQFTSGVWFPVVKSVVAAAEKAQDDYFRVKYLSAEGGEDRETGKSESTAGA